MRVERWLATSRELDTSLGIEVSDPWHDEVHRGREHEVPRCMQVRDFIHRTKATSEIAATCHLDLERTWLAHIVLVIWHLYPFGHGWQRRCLLG